jgi:hypothetical protein
MTNYGRLNLTTMQMCLPLTLLSPGGDASTVRHVRPERVEALNADDANYSLASVTEGEHPRLRELADQIRRLREEGEMTPNSVARQITSRLLADFEVFSLPVRRVMVCADGGITLRLGHGERAVTVDCYNSGVVTVARSSGPGTTVAEEVDPADESSLTRLIGDLREFTAV